MANGNYRADDINRRLSYSGAHGNLSVMRSGPIVIPATGVQNELIDFMVARRGWRLVDCLLRNSGDTAGATSTIQVGIAQIPGKSTTKVDDDALITATTLTTGNQLTRRKNAAVDAAGLTLDDDYLIQGKIAGADIGTNPVTVELDLIYENLGTL